MHSVSSVIDVVSTNLFSTDIRLKRLKYLYFPMVAVINLISTQTKLIKKMGPKNDDGMRYQRYKWDSGYTLDY